VTSTERVLTAVPNLTVIRWAVWDIGQTDRQLDNTFPLYVD